MPHGSPPVDHRPALAALPCPARRFMQIVPADKHPTSTELVPRWTVLRWTRIGIHTPTVDPVTTGELRLIEQARDRLLHNPRKGLGHCVA